MEPAKLTRLVKGELDWIVMKALEKDRNRRYETANGFAADVQRYLNDEPVLACPPSAGYRLRKLLRRHKTRFAVGGMLAGFLLLLGIGIAWIALDKAQRQVQIRSKVEAALEDGARRQAAQEWLPGLEVCKSAEALLASASGMDDLRRQLQELRRDLDAAARLDEIMLMQAETDIDRNRFAQSRSLAEYAKVFEDYGIRVGVSEVEAAAALVRKRPEPIRNRLVAALDDWWPTAWWEKRRQQAKWLREMSQAVDVDELRKRIRLAADLIRTDKKGARIALENLVESTDLARQPPQTLLLLGRALYSVEA